MQQDGTRRGCFDFTKPQWIAIIVVGLIFGVWSWATEDRRPTLSLNAMVTISSSTAPGIVDLRTCDTMSERFGLTILSGDDDETSTRLKEGEKQRDGSCLFRVRTQIVTANAYTIVLDDRFNVASQSVHITHDDAVRTAEDGHEWLLVFADW